MLTAFNGVGTSHHDEVSLGLFGAVALEAIHLEDGTDLFLEVHRIRRVEDQSRGEGGGDGDESVHAVVSDVRIPPGRLPVSNAVTPRKHESFNGDWRFVPPGNRWKPTE
jgi:hypothetical protein